MAGKNNGQLLEFMRTSLGRIRNEKQGAAATEAGGYSGPSAHPSANEDDQAQTAPEGARSSENTADIAEEVHQGTGVDTRQGTEGGGDDDNQYNIGQQQAATGEDPSSEDPDKINAKDDADVNNQQTSHPAKGDTKQSAQIKEARALGNKLMAQIAVLNPEGEKQAAEGDSKEDASEEDASEEEKQAEGQEHKVEGDMKPQMDNKHDYDEDGSQAKKSDAGATEKKEKPDPDKPKAASADNEDFQAGKEAAKEAAVTLEDQEKQAAEVIGNIEKSAAADADMVCDFIAGYHDGQTKAAMENGDMEGYEDDEGEDHKGNDEDEEVPADEGGGEGEMDAGAAVEDMMGAAEPEGNEGGDDLAALLGGGGGGAPGGAGGIDPAILAALLGGGAGGAGGAPGGLGAPGGAEGIDPAILAALMGGGAGGGAGGAPGGLGQQEVMACLQQAVQAEGMSPEALKIAASFVDEARQTDRQRQTKQAAQRILVAQLRGRLQTIKAAAAKEAAAKQQAAAAAAAAAATQQPEPAAAK